MIKKSCYLLVIFIILLVSCSNQKDEKIIMQYDSSNLGLNSFTLSIDKDLIDVNNPIYSDIYLGQTSHQIIIRYYRDIEHKTVYDDNDYANNKKIYIDYDIIITKEIPKIDDMVRAFKYYDNEEIKINYYLGEFNDVKMAALQHEGDGWHSVSPERIGNVIFQYNDNNSVMLCFYNNEFYSLTEIYEMNLISYNDVIFINSLFRLNMVNNFIYNG